MITWSTYIIINVTFVDSYASRGHHWQIINSRPHNYLACNYKLCFVKLPPREQGKLRTRGGNSKKASLLI